MDFDLNMDKGIRKELQSKEYVYMDLDKLNRGSEINETENQSDMVTSGDSSVCCQHNECPPSRTAPQDYNFRFLGSGDNMINPLWKKANHCINNVDTKKPEHFENCSFPCSSMIYSGVKQDDITASNTNNMPQNYNLLQWSYNTSRFTSGDSISVPSANTRKALNILEANDTSGMIVVDPANDSQQSTMNIENIHSLQNKQRSLCENQQDSPKKGAENKTYISSPVEFEIKMSRDNYQELQKLPVLLKTSMHARHEKRDIFSTDKNASFFCPICDERLPTKFSAITHMNSHQHQLKSYRINFFETREGPR